MSARTFPFRLAAMLVALAVSQVRARAGETEAAAGGAAFEPCRACHSLEADGGKAAGPNLKGLVGRPVAGDEAFAYSPVLRAAGFAGEVWSAETLDRFLSDPEAMYPGLWMADRHEPLPDAAVRKAIADFIADPNAR
jgi:cytochrome c